MVSIATNSPDPNHCPPRISAIRKMAIGMFGLGNEFYPHIPLPSGNMGVGFLGLKLITIIPDTTSNRAIIMLKVMGSSNTIPPSTTPDIGITKTKE